MVANTSPEGEYTTSWADNLRYGRDWRGPVDVSKTSTIPGSTSVSFSPMPIVRSGWRNSALSEFRLTA